MPWWKSLSILSENKGVFGLNMLAWQDREGLDRVIEPLSKEIEAGTIEIDPVVAEAFPFDRAGGRPPIHRRAPEHRQGRARSLVRGCSEAEPRSNPFVLARRRRYDRHGAGLRSTEMRPGRLDLVLALALLAVASAAGPAAASARPGLTRRRLDGPRARRHAAAASINVLTLNDQRRIDNRISAYMSSSGRLVLTAPEGLGDPDGDGSSCALDNAKAGETSATEASCAAGYIGAIVGDLSGGSDTFDADPGLAAMVGGVINGQARPLAGGPGRDRLVGGSLSDLLDGGGGADSIAGGGGRTCMFGGPGADNLSGGGGSGQPPGRRRPGQAQRRVGQGRLPRRAAGRIPPRAARPLAGFRRCEGVMRGRAARRDALVSPSNPFSGEAGL